MPSKKPTTSSESGTESIKLQQPTRRGSKPQVEKRRRARINQSLFELQALVIDEELAKNKLKNRIEKADILEQTVAHIKSMRERDNLPNQPKAEPSPSSGNSLIRKSSNKFNTGYLECATKASQFLLEVENVEQGLHDRLKSYLTNVYEELNSPSENPSPSTSPNPSTDEDSRESSAFSRDAGCSSSESDGSERLQTPESPMPYAKLTPEPSNRVVQMIPRRLANGQLAFFLPHEGLDRVPKLSDRELAFRVEPYNPFQQSNYLAPPLPHYSMLAHYEFAERQRQLLMMNGSDPRHPFHYHAPSYMGTPNGDHCKHWRPW